MKKNEHKTGSDIKDWKTRAEVPPNEIKPFLDNPFLKDFHGHSMIYTKDFYMALYKKISDEHMTYVEAYNALGFDTGILGTNRANAAGKRAVRMAEENRLFTVAPSSYNGSVPREQMGNMSLQEELAYLKARNAYLEELVRSQKKIPSELAAILISLNQKR